MPPVNHVILLVIDDLRADQFHSLMNEGKLPNIKEYLMNGIISDNTACYPAISYPAISTMLTGCYPDSYGFPGGHWVVRNKKRIRNYNKFRDLTKVNDELGDQVKTIFELIEGPTATLSTGITRGSSHYYPTKREIARISIWHFLILRRNIQCFNVLLINKFLDYFNKPQKFFEEGPPKLTVLWFFSSDHFLHKYGSHSEQYLQLLQEIDLRIGQIINGKGKRKGLKELGYFDDTVFVVTSDHGNYAAKKWIDIAPYFDQIGLIPLIPKKQDGNFDATMGSLGFFTLRGNTWLERPTIAQMQNYGPNHVNLINNALLNIPGVKFLYYREDGNTFEKGQIHVLKKENGDIYTGLIEYQNDKTKYTFNKDELYGYSEDETATTMLDGKFHTIDEWLKNTHHVDFPIVVDQVPRLFRNPNSCDIMISTCGETIFNYEHGRTKNDHLYGHDIALQQAITVPLLIAGSQIPKKTLPYSKSTDIVPTILKLLGEPIPSNLLGNSLL
ncbi:MAG: alkaline phosphatase family protein [Promethearchaeota archaeon]